MIAMQMPNLPNMRKAARVFGVIWMVGAALAGIMLFGSGVFHGGRGYIYVLFGAALPGVLIFRWGDNAAAKQKAFVEKRMRRKERVDMTAEAGHVMELETDPIKALEGSIPPVASPLPHGKSRATRKPARLE